MSVDAFQAEIERGIRRLLGLPRQKAISAKAGIQRNLGGWRLPCQIPRALGASRRHGAVDAQDDVCPNQPHQLRNIQNGRQQINFF